MMQKVEKLLMLQKKKYAYQILNEIRDKQFLDENSKMIFLEKKLDVRQKEKVDELNMTKRNNA